MQKSLSSRVPIVPKLLFGSLFRSPVPALFTSYSFPHANLTKTKLFSLQTLENENFSALNSMENSQEMIEFVRIKIKLLENNFNQNQAFNCLAILVESSEFSRLNEFTEEIQQIIALIVKNVTSLNKVYSVAYILRHTFRSTWTLEEEQIHAFLSQFVYLIKNDFDDQPRMGPTLNHIMRFLSENPKHEHFIREIEEELCGVIFSKLMFGDASFILIHMSNLKSPSVLRIGKKFLSVFSRHQYLISPFTLFAALYFHYTWRERDLLEKGTRGACEIDELVWKVIQNCQTAYLEEEQLGFKKSMNISKKLAQMLLFLLRETKKKYAFAIEEDFLRLIEDVEKTAVFDRRDGAARSQILKFNEEFKDLFDFDSIDPKDLF